MLLRKAYKDSDLGTVCRMVIVLSLLFVVWWPIGNLMIRICDWLQFCPLSQASRILRKFMEPVAVQEVSVSPGEINSGDESSKSEVFSPFTLVDYSNMFGEEFQLPDDQWDSNYLNTLDLGAVEEGILHVLYACASQVNYSNRDMELLAHIFFFPLPSMSVFISATLILQFMLLLVSSANPLQ